FEMPEATARAWRNGWFHTGDGFRRDDDGNFYFVDRLKDAMRKGGENISSLEVEGYVREHPGVLEVAAIGVPDEHSGEVPKLFIVKKDPALTAQAVIEFCKDKLTGYKRPKHVEFRTELPKTNVGKILRRALRDEKKAA
ncbi:MAG: class I adenylate-forming enzyme family protein, partial [Geminicoccales bacterium]